MRVNRLEGPVTLGTTDRLFLTVEVDPGEFAGQTARLRLIAGTPSGSQYYDLASVAFKGGFEFSYQGPLPELPTQVVWDDAPAPGLQVGETTFYLSVVLNPGEAPARTD